MNIESRKLAPKQLPKRRSEAAKPKRNGRKRQKPDAKSARPDVRRSWRKSARGSARKERRRRSASVARGKRTRPVKRRVRKKRNEGARSVRSGRRKTRSAGARTGRELTRRGKRSAYASRRSARSTKRVVRPASRRFVKKMLNESGAYKRSSTEIEAAVVGAVVDVAGLPSVTEIVADETGAGGGAGQGPAHLNAAHL